MHKNLQIDNLDKKILSLIQKDARIPFLEVARECGVSGAAIHQRIQRLKDVGIITGSEFKLDPKKLGYQTTAFIGIFLDKGSLYKDVIKKLEAIKEIEYCHYTTGVYGIFAKVHALDNEHLKNILNDRIQSIKGIASTETFISLDVGFRNHLPIG